MKQEIINRNIETLKRNGWDNAELVFQNENSNYIYFKAVSPIHTHLSYIISFYGKQKSPHFQIFKTNEIDLQLKLKIEKAKLAI